MQTPLTGLWPPACTPFTRSGAVDETRLIGHCKKLLAEGATGLAILGTTSEANSLTLDERRRVIDALIAARVPPGRLLPGTGACAIDDAVVLMRHAAELGCAGALLLPPFYYKNVSDDGLFAFVAAAIERCGVKVPRILLYHFPQMAAAGWSIELIGRLREAFPETIVGIKDSTGNADHTKAVIDAFPGFAVFPGAEVYLLKALQWGAVGCISATANINAGGIARLIERQHEPDAPARQDELTAIRKAFDGYVTISAVKAMIAALTRDEEWLRVRPPLTTLSEAERRTFLAKPALAGLLDAVAA